MPIRKATSVWQDKCVIITGATGGIGSAVARHLGREKARIGLLGRRSERLQQLQRELASDAVEAACACTDVTASAQVRSAVASVESRLGACDVLIACAGIYRQTPGRQFDVAAANEVIATNVQGVINAFGAVLPAMVERGEGHLAAVSSIAGLVALPAAGAYVASKSALVILLRSLRLDLHATNVRVTTVCPGYVDTPLITDDERATLKTLVTPEHAARRIARAIERNKAEDWFPWRTWLPAYLAGLLPPTALRWVSAMMPEMEETDTDSVRNA